MRLKGIGSPTGDLKGWFGSILIKGSELPHAPIIALFRYVFIGFVVSQWVTLHFGLITNKKAGFDEPGQSKEVKRWWTIPFPHY